MSKSSLINTISVYSIIYTAITLLNSILYLGNGIYEDPGGNWHELDRAMILLIGFAAFKLCTSLPVKPLIFRYLIAYVPSMLLAFACVWFTELREPLAKPRTGTSGLTSHVFLSYCALSTLLPASVRKQRMPGSAKHPHI